VSDDGFRLRAGERFGAAVARIVREETDGILDRLDGDPDETAVHEIRKATKRLRALARLVRGDLGDRRFARANRTFRDAARALSAARDVAIVRRTLDRLAADGGGALAPFRRAVAARARGTSSLREAARDAGATMRRARTGAVRWQIDDGGRVLRPGFRRIYRKARDAWRAAKREPSDERLHEWRKRVKDLRYALELLEPLRPKKLHRLAGDVDDLTDVLGDDHDLAMLRRFVVDPLGGHEG